MRRVLRLMPWRLVLSWIHLARPLLGERFERAIISLVNPKLSHFLPPDIPAPEFFRNLNAQGLEYVILRWFEHLPPLERRHDLDILVADEGVEKMLAALSRWPLGHPVDIYSETGVCGMTYSVEDARSAERIQMPLFPPVLSRKLLERRVLHENNCYVPCAEDHFAALAYHVVHLKGAATGVPSGTGGREALKPGSHDYVIALRELASRIGIDLSGEVTRARLSNLLTQLGWSGPELPLRWARLRSTTSL